MLVEAAPAQHGAHADHKKRSEACQEPNTALGAFRKRSVGRECKMIFCVGKGATASNIVLRSRHDIHR